MLYLLKCYECDINSFILNMKIFKYRDVVYLCVSYKVSKYENII